MNDSKPGKKNKVRVGQKVKLVTEGMKWYAYHLSWSMGENKHGKDGYSKGEKEIPANSLMDVYFILSCHLSSNMPYGFVSHFGSEGDYDKNGKYSEQLKCVWVDFYRNDPEFGLIEWGTYVSEKDLVRVVPKKRKKK